VINKISRLITLDCEGKGNRKKTLNNEEDEKKRKIRGESKGDSIENKKRNDREKRTKKIVRDNLSVKDDLRENRDNNRNSRRDFEGRKRKRIAWNRRDFAREGQTRKREGSKKTRNG
jgi:hypothetical protein